MSENPIIIVLKTIFSLSELQMFTMVLLPILFLIILPRTIWGGILSQLMSKGLDVVKAPLDLAIRILRELALQRILNWILSKFEEYALQKVFSITYLQLLIIGTCILFLAVTPGHILPAEVITLSSFVLLVIEKIYTLRLAKTAMQHAKELEKQAAELEKCYEFGLALDEYSNAFDVYRHSLLLRNPILDGERVKLLEKMATLLYKLESYDKALTRYNQALDLYKKPHILNYTTVKDRARVLQKSADLLFELGRRREAQKRYELIYELTGRQVSYW